MATSKITLYKTNLTPTKYWKLDDIEKYLDTCQSTVLSGVKYVKPDLTNTIKVPRGQEYLASLGLGLNYLKVVTTEDSKILSEHTEYYFITSYDWGGKKGVTLNLLLDTLNTVGGTEMTDTTQIIREHQDRWTKGTGYYYAKVDKYPEGLSVVKDTLTSSSTVQSTTMYAIQISRNATTPDLTDKTPYGTYFCFNSNTTFTSSGTGSVYYTTLSTARNTSTVTALLNAGTFQYLIEGSDSNTWSSLYTIGTNTTTSGGQTGILRAILISCNNISAPTYFKIKYLYYTGDTYPYSFLTSTSQTISYSGSLTSTTNIFKFNNTRYKYTATNSAYIRDSLTNLDTFMNVFSPTEIKAGSYPAQVVTGISNLDRTNSSIMAIYQVPYISMTTSNAKFVEGYNLLKLNSYTSDYQFSTMPSLSKLYKNSLPSPQTSYWSKDYETKLFSNEISDIGLYYQGDCLFNFDASRYTSNAIPTMSVSMRLSEDNPQLLRFYFTCSQYTFHSKYENYAYELAKYSVPLYTSEWTDYVRNGYNYDVVERDRQKKLQKWNIATGVASAVFSGMPTFTAAYQNFKENITNNLTALAQKKANQFVNEQNIGWEPYNAAPIANGSRIPTNYRVDFQNVSGEKAYTIGHAKPWTVAKTAIESGLSSLATTKGLESIVLNQGINAVGSVGTAISSVNAANASYQQILNTKAASHTAISGNNTDYKSALDNTLELQYWQPQNYVLENIAKTFHLTGYNHPVQEVPNTKSRYWFNYLQCIPVWSEATINNYRPEFLNDLSDKYQSGVTIFHYNEGYDLDQKKENMEVNLI